ncbi:MAG TPA: RNA pyrophosphohydrolase [Alphaproteobacteria bacterium]|nr:RNA pyrophosphohydrolase [Alphaproteobacteria bacterium]
MTDKNNLPYRPCVGAMLFNSDGQVFVARRIDTVAEAWQMPQGGIDDGEDPRDAVLRELEEEIGTDKFEIVSETDDWLTYDLPDELIGKVWRGRYRGQRMKWFALRFTGTDSDIDLDTDHPEFEDWRWLPLDQIADMIVPFKRTVYQAVRERFGHLPGEMKA